MPVQFDEPVPVLTQVMSEWPIELRGDPLVEQELPVEVDVAGAAARFPAVDVRPLDETVGDPNRPGRGERDRAGGRNGNHERDTEHYCHSQLEFHAHAFSPGGAESVSYASSAPSPGVLSFTR